MASVGVFVVAILAIYQVMVRLHKGRTVNWQQAATSLGLQYQAPRMGRPQHMYGHIDGLKVSIWSYTEGTGDNRATYTGYQVKHAPVGPPVSLSRQTKFSFMRSLVGKRDVVIGDPLFDNQVVVDTDNDEQLAAFLTPIRRSAVVAVLTRWPLAEITHDSISVSSSRVEKSSVLIEDTTRYLVDIAKVMGAPSAAEAILQQRDDGDLAASVEALHELNEAEPNQFLADIEAEAVASTELRQPERDQSAEPVAAVDAVVDLDQQAVIDDLFGTGRRGSDVDTRFNTVYRSAPVTWTGTVTSVRPFRVDADFGHIAGTKVVVDLGETATSKYTTSRIEAIVGFPEGTEFDRDDPVAFTGTLLKVDRFMRKIYVNTT